MMRFNAELMKFYEKAPLRYKLYTIIRYAICPFSEVERYIPNNGDILDCGCGHGVFANFLAMKSEKRYIVGTDINENKIKIASIGLSERKNTEFKVKDIEKSLDDKRVRCITLIDVLCYIPLDKKRELFKKLYNSLQPGGGLVIKSMQETPRLKYWAIQFHMAVIDKLMHRGFKKSSYFIKKDDFLCLLKSAGFEVEFKDVSRGYPYPHCLYVCSKAG